jgi:hypothetical protein
MASGRIGRSLSSGIDGRASGERCACAEAFANRKEYVL